MDILKAEASRARAEALSVNNGSKTGINGYGGEKRYLRRGEVERLKKEAAEKVCGCGIFIILVIL